MNDLSLTMEERHAYSVYRQERGHILGTAQRLRLTVPKLNELLSTINHKLDMQLATSCRAFSRRERTPSECILQSTAG